MRPNDILLDAESSATSPEATTDGEMFYGPYILPLSP
jgi:hypothetical protein